jgi:GNAT superfamily N-acetyltransferase
MAEQEIAFSELTSGDLPDLIDAIAEIGRETDAHNQDILDVELWKWQYQALPTRTSYTYIARHNGKIAGYYHIATYDFLAGDQKLRIGQIQSVAVSPSFRGQGLFRRLADFAHDELMAHLDLIYTFPNTRSIHTFLKYNDYLTVKPLPMLLLPLHTSEIIRSRGKFFGLEAVLGWVIDLWGKALRKGMSSGESIVVRTSFDDEALGVFETFQNAHALRLLRNRDYMNWRYLETPKGRHFIVGLERDGKLKSVAVLKYEELFSTRGLLVVDFAYEDDPADLNKLLGGLPSLFGAGLPHEAAFILVSALTPAVKELKKAGFISVPQKLIPRQLNLLTRWMRTRSDIDIHDPDLWLVTLGDWDVF